MYVGLFLGSPFCTIDLCIVLMPLSHCLDCCSFVIEFKIKECAASSFALLAHGSIQILEEELKSLLMKVKEENEKADLKLNIQNTKVMASDAITSWQIDGVTIGTVTNFIFLGSKITVNGDCSHELKICLLIVRKAMTNLHSILKSRDITLLTKVCIVKAIVFQ